MDPDRFAADVAAHLARLVAGLRPPDAPRPGLLVALSGGPDSTALLLAARRWADDTGGRLEAAHLHHGLRGSDADADQAFCVELCARLDVPLHTRHEDPRPVARTRGGGLEEAGRHLRRRFLTGLLDADPGLHAVATGHQRDDQAETVLMRLLRGAGPDGLAGIRPVAGRFVHPLLPWTRRDVLAFLEAAGQPWRHDASNDGRGNLRARLRRELLPLVRDIFGTGSLDAPARLAELLGDDLDLLAAQAAAAADGLRRGDGLDVPGLLALPPALARRVLHGWLAAGDPVAAPARAHVEAVLDWLRRGVSGTTLDLPGAMCLRRTFDRLERADGAASPRRREAADYRIVVADGAAAEPAPAGHGAPDDESTWRLTCPADALQGALRVRNWRAGDRMRPFGLDGTKKLSDLFREKRLPAEARRGVLVVEDDAGILWAVGLARAERTRMLPTTGAAVTMTVARRSPPPKRGQDTR